MDAAVCKTSNEEIQDGTLRMSSQNGDIMSSPKNLQMPSRKSEILEKYNMEETMSQNINGCVDENAHKFDTSPNLSNNLSQKSLSPTLIEHAFQVVKNIFSPERNRSKSSKILSSAPQNQILSGSTCSNVYMQNLGRESIASEYEISNPGAIEISSKVDSLCVNEWGSTPSSFSQESYNSSVADESFLTTVSLIEDSFQSAVTHLDETRDAVKNESEPSAFNFSNSQNSSFLNPSNNTFSGSEYDMENTVLENGYFGLDGKTDEITENSGNDGDVSSTAKNVTFEIEKNEGTEGVICENYVESLVNGRNVVCEMERENDLEASDDKNLSSAGAKEVEKHEKGAMENSEKIICENSTEEVEKGKCSFSNEISVKNEGVQVNSQNGNSENLSRQTETKVSEEAGNESDSNISTTTIVLADSHSESDSVSLSKPEIVEKKSSAPSIEGSESSKKFSLTNLRKSTGSGNRMVMGNGSKPNKSFDLFERNKFYDSAENFRQKMTEEFVFNLSEGEKAEEPSDYFPQEMVENRKFSETECEANERGDKVNSPVEMSSSNSSCFLDDSISLSSQQSYTILSNSNSNLKRPVIESMEEFNGDWQLSNCQSSIATADEDLDMRKTLSDFTRKWPNLSSETVNFVSGPKQSTSLTNSTKTFSIKEESDLMNSKRSHSGNEILFAEETVRKMNDFSELKFSLEEKGLAINGEFSKPTDSGKSIDGESRLLMAGEKYDGTSEAKNISEIFGTKQDGSIELNRILEVESKTPSTKIKFNQCFEKARDKDRRISAVKGKNVVFPEAEESKEKEEKEEEKKKKELAEEIMKPKSFSIVEAKFSELDFAGESSEKSSDKEGTNSSFISTTSSNTSLLCNGNVTVLPADRGSAEGKRFLGEEFPGLEEKSTEPSLKTKENEEWIDARSSPFSPLKMAEEEKDSRDNDLVQFIGEQFTAMEIEKICSVVEDFTGTGKNPAELPVAADKKVETNSDGESLSSEKNLPKAMMTPWSPHSLDFLNSIGGKATGRDLSRESLYVKFDPLVSAQIANSLIDFTKEAEPVPVEESSTETDSVIEQLLDISPQKKSDEIVPPLTPLSQKSKNSSTNDDKVERVKQLQNEIYFLKNLYAERERTNRGKLESYEGQIARLTGQNCVLEERLKESNEREKSLVKKLHEQNQCVSQLKTIVDEYAKVISKLTSEWENMKNENQKQLASLNMEKNSYVTHLQNTEAAFTDVHAKYEKSKKTIVNLKTNESMFRNTIAEQSQKIEDYKERMREIQERAQNEFDRIQEDLAKTKSTHVQETTRLKAQLRKTELKLEAVQESLDQKIKENQQLTAICDELIEGKK